jgi:anti-sigma regulatory factor (Ser/Thr protein kinase)
MAAPSSERDEARTFRLRLPATPSSLAIFRDTLRGWLSDHCLPPADIFDIVLACSESLTLVIEDQPRQTALVVEVSADLDGNRLVVRTRDYGLWQESHVLPCEEPLSLALMRALMDSVELERHPDGQTVTLVRHVFDGSAGGRTALLI